MPNGQIFYNDSEIKDCDGDDLADGEEIFIDYSETQFVIKKDKRGGNIEYSTVVFGYKSNPNDIDSDGDGYTDAEEYIYDSNPLINSVGILAELKNDYISVAKDDRIFGGYQGWFEKDYPYIKQLGCGIIGSCDVLLYLYQNGEISNDELFMNIPATGTIPYNSYYKFIENYYKNYCTIETAFDTRGTRIANCMEDFFDSCGMNTTVKWGKMTTFDGSIDTYLSMASEKFEELVLQTNKINKYYKSRSMEQMAIEIMELLNDNIPVMISSGEYSRDIYLFESDKLYLEKNSYTDNLFSDHYATITKIQWNDVFDTYVLEVSSWGKKYYIDFEQYYENKDIYSDIFSIKL